MIKLIWNGWSWRCEECNGTMALPGIVPDLQTLIDRNWRYCPYCGRKIDYRKTKKEMK